jgi:gamma-glutamyl-gamma-aminobutyrate hydrolase PuuD
VTDNSYGKPVIGISANAEPAQWAGWREHATLVPHAYVDRVAAAGCVPVVLPPVAGAERAMSRLDGLLLSGGGDLSPSLYAARPHPRTARVDTDRDAAELALLQAAFDAGLPVLGICRGLQLLNVLRSGTLLQHLPETVGHDGHAPGPAVYGQRAVRVTAGSRMARILGRDALDVPCHHHQAIERLGGGLTATARSDDGVIEAVELDGYPFAVAVQWHPEVSEDRSLFLALAEAARSRAASREDDRHPDRAVAEGGCAAGAPRARGARR